MAYCLPGIVIGIVVGSTRYVTLIHCERNANHCRSGEFVHVAEPEVEHYGASCIAVERVFQIVYWRNLKFGGVGKDCRVECDAIVCCPYREFILVQEDFALYLNLHGFYRFWILMD